jgi:DNA-binding NarL/FixJ family response regulator
MEDRPQAFILIADDHHVVLEGIQKALMEHPGFAVAGTASDGRDTVEQVRKIKPDILILDVSMPGMNGIKVAEKVKRESPRTRILVYSMHTDSEYVRALFRTGISGYVLKEEPLRALVEALETVRNGSTFYSRKIDGILRENVLSLGACSNKEDSGVRDGVERLSGREKEVLRLLADGMSIQEIAERLRISPKIAETHSDNVFEKLGTRSLAELTKIAIRNGLVEL